MFKFPTLISVQVHAFSLYHGEPNASFHCSEGVTCLVGANGLGKSTLLNAISYALTGIVPDPSRVFKSFDEYYARCLPYADKYFTGRIVESDREAAAVTLTFGCGSRFFRITRKLFDPGELEEYAEADSIERLSALQDDPFLTRRQKQLLFEQNICHETGFSSFSQFACFHHFVCTFDEKRTLLLYSDKLVEQILNTVFLLDSNLAIQIDSLRREGEKYDSRVRNLQWDITKFLKRISETKKRSASSEGLQSKLIELEEEYDHLKASYTDQSNMSSIERGKLDDLTLELAQLSAKEATLRDEFSRTMGLLSQGKPNVRDLPQTKLILSEGLCLLCGEKSDWLKERALRQIENAQCPVCDSKISPKEALNDDSFTALQALDIEISNIRKKLRDTASALLRQQENYKILEASVSETLSKLQSFELESLNTMAALRSTLEIPSNQNYSLIADHTTQLLELQTEKSEAIKMRSEISEKLSELRNKLRSQFLELEDEFVPLFRDWAHTFLGVDIDIRLDDSASSSVKLIISVRGSNRREEFTLSESQKFFLDIAFRMALLQFASTKEFPSTLVLDTPEGSLDIAYEKRAGVMLADFVSKNNRVLMTANLNSSHLLLALARQCGEPSMLLISLMDWATLTSVQQEESELFSLAMDRIVEELSQGK